MSATLSFDANDGVIDGQCFEECDDGNDAAGDGCRECVIEGWECPATLNQ